MSDTKVFTFPEAGGGSGILGALAPLLQRGGLDPNMVFAMMNGRNNSGFGGEGGWFIWVIFLFFLMGWGNGGWGNNGFGGGGNGANGIPNLINNDNGRELLMQAIQGNGNAINQLASTLNCSVGQIQQSLNQVMSQVQGVGNTVGMSAQQIINAIQSGNTSIAQQIASCCCESRLAICQQTNTLTTTMNQNTLSLRDAGTNNTNAILAKLDAMQNQGLLDKIDALREKNTSLTAQLSQEHQTAIFGQMIGQATAPISAAVGALQADVNGIKCKLPETATVPYSPIVGVPTCVAAQYGIYGGFPPVPGNGFWG